MFLPLTTITIILTTLTTGLDCIAYLEYRVGSFLVASCCAKVVQFTKYLEVLKYLLRVQYWRKRLQAYDNKYKYFYSTTP